MVIQIYKVNPESDRWINDIENTLRELISKKYRLFINVYRKFDEIWIMENIWREEKALNLKFVGTEILTIKIEPPLLKRYATLITNIIVQYLTNGIQKTVEYTTQQIINDPNSPTTSIEFLL